MSGAERAELLYADLRDKFEPGKPLWITETADAACGGNPWASTFLDTFRYLVQHGSLAQQGPTSGALVLFNLPLAATENRPLTLRIQGPAGTTPAQAQVTLDI